MGAVGVAGMHSMPVQHHPRNILGVRKSDRERTGFQRTSRDRFWNDYCFERCP
jgi:hypothetical protein